MMEPQADTTGKSRGPVVPVEILEDPWTPAAEVERIAAELAQKGCGERPRAGHDRFGYG